MKIVEIKEHQTSIHEDLELCPDDMSVVKKLKDSKILEIQELRRGIEIKSSEYVGVVKFANFEVVVNPKIHLPSQNLIRLIAYACEFDDIVIYDKDVSVATAHENLLDILINFFAIECRRLVSIGLLKSYVTHDNDDASFLRGRLLLSQQVIHMAKKKPSFACRYDELEFDNLENQILYYCLKRCFHITKSPRLKKETGALARQFSALMQYVEIYPDFKQVQYTRLNKHYESLHKLAQLIIDSTGIGNFDSVDTDATSSFFINMNSIFENFVAKIFDKYHPCMVEYQKSMPAWTGDKTRTIRPDILLNSKIVVDAKYKRDLDTCDLYQIGFYMHESKHYTGYAILPAYESAICDYTITSPKQNIAIHVKTINLNCVMNILDSNKDDEMYNMLCDIVPMEI